MLTKKPGTSLLPTGKVGEPVYSPGLSGSQTASPVALPRLRNHNLTGGSKAGMSEAPSSQASHLHEENSNRRAVLTSQPNGLHPVGSSRPGERSERPDPRWAAPPPTCPLTQAEALRRADPRSGHEAVHGQDVDAGAPRGVQLPPRVRRLLVS
ncbi:hypothetical protein CesoFtcFv8_026348 [Champsocephalus esox]|uniref:Uncharacterized protein n=1 Tax=Champsocephalus esox TaxID=159716 RepID=A0AAN8B242_9TELE|nr:hypothetical protein CesoFtcFv8_026348 [Champsocephalus esox]